MSQAERGAHPRTGLWRAAALAGLTTVMLAACAHGGLVRDGQEEVDDEGAGGAKANQGTGGTTQASGPTSTNSSSSGPSSSASGPSSSTSGSTSGTTTSSNSSTSAGPSGSTSASGPSSSASGGTGDCCAPTGAPGCGDASVEQCVCAQDDYCCTTEWDQQCVDQVDQFGCGSCGGSSGSGPSSGSTGPTTTSTGPTTTSGGGSGACCTPTANPGCIDDANIEACVCAQDDYCCIVEWDQQCVDEVDSFGCGTCF